MRVLVACEFSGVVRTAFRSEGHEAFSCDLLPAEDQSKWHIQGDVLEVIADRWDLMIAHPPCTFLSVSGLHWNKRVAGRAEKTEEALEFVRRLMAAPITRIAIENPISCISTRIRKPDQIIQPWEFGHRESKSTCLWLRNLTPLQPTEIVSPTQLRCCGIAFPFELGVHGCPNCKGDNVARPLWDNQTPSGQNKLGPSPDRWKERSKTYDGIARAMAQQWGSAVR